MPQGPVDIHLRKAGRNPGPLDPKRHLIGPRFDKGGRNDEPSQITRRPAPPAPMRPAGAPAPGTLTLAQSLYGRAQAARRAGVMRYEMSDSERRQAQAMFPHADITEALRRIDAAMRLLHDTTPMEDVTAAAGEYADCWEVNNVVVSKPLALGEMIEVKAQIDGRLEPKVLFRLQVCERRL